MQRSRKDFIQTGLDLVRDPAEPLESVYCIQKKFYKIRMRKRLLTPYQALHTPLDSLVEPRINRISATQSLLKMSSGWRYLLPEDPYRALRGRPRTAFSIKGFRVEGLGDFGRRGFQSPSLGVWVKPLGLRSAGLI